MTKRHKGTAYQLRHVGALLPPDGFGTLVSVGLGPDGPVAMWAGAGAGKGVPDGIGRRADLGKPGRTVALASYSTLDLVPANVVIAPFRVAPAYVQPLRDGGYLVARSRCEWTPEGPEKNAAVVDPEGRIARSGTLGDGIANLQVDRDGRIWVGYFDEGVAGNLGWGFDGPEPLGAPGLVRWSPAFEKEWELPSDAGVSVIDCYAMSVSDDCVVAFTYAYEGFAVVRVRDDHPLTHMVQGSDGATGVVVAGDVVGLVGSYNDRRLMVTTRLEHSSTGKPRRGRLALPDGKPLPPRFALECRGSTVNVFDGPEWFELDVSAAA